MITVTHGWNIKRGDETIATVQLRDDNQIIINVPTLLTIDETVELADALAMAIYPRKYFPGMPSA